MGRRPKSLPGYAECIAEMKVMYETGASLRECAGHFGVSVPTVKDWLKRADVRIRSTGEGTRLYDSQHGRRQKYDISEDELRRLYLDEHWSVEKLAQHFGIHVDTVRDRMDRAGIARTREARTEARKLTNLERYGGISPNYSPEVRERTEATNLERYGVVNPFASEQGKAKIRETNLDRLGVANPTQNPEVIKKRRQTNRRLRGVDHHLQTNWDPRTVAILASRETFEGFLTSSGLDTVLEIAQSLGVDTTTIQLRLKEFDLWGRIDASHQTSALEREVGKILADRGVSMEKDKEILGRQHIDLYSDEHKIGIETNGTWWHSEVHKHRKYHQAKSLLAARKGVFLYHVFEYEWSDEHKRRLVHSQLDNLFGLNTRSIGARQCEVRELDAKVKNAFLDVNHLQGADRARVKLGLYLGDELVSVMTFSDNPRNKEYQWELSRFASLVGTNVVGAASRLFTNFVRQYHPDSVLSYSDLAKTRGSLYESLGFEFSHVSEPNYIWTNGPKIIPRYQTQMKDESQIMTQRGYVRIYDCGSKVWVWRRS